VEKNTWMKSVNEKRQIKRDFHKIEPPNPGVPGKGIRSDAAHRGPLIQTRGGQRTTRRGKF
jgi:hypothetical protein